MRGLNRLSARAVATLTEAGYHADGGGLYLQVTWTGAKSWVFRFKRGGKARDMGLGPAHTVSLLEARQAALQARKLVAEGRDPIAERMAARALGPVTWGWCVDEFIAVTRAGWKNEAQAEQWTQSLRDHGPDRALPIASVSTAVVVASLGKLWQTKTETASRLRGRIERVWDWARVSGHVGGENPARWKGHLDKLLPKPTKVRKAKHHAAMPYTALPAFMAELRRGDSLSRRAMEFAILTAARTSEVTGAQWDEFDGDVWVRPAGRMKAGKPHAIPLVPEASAILAALPRDRPPFAMSENTMLFLLQREPPRGLGKPYTVHGFRSTFSDWAHETTGFPNHVIEMALAHTIKSKAEAAYRRGDLMEKRRELMQAWADYLSAPDALHFAADDPAQNVGAGRPGQR
jgi:integrase